MFVSILDISVVYCPSGLCFRYDGLTGFCCHTSRAFGLLSLGLRAPEILKEVSKLESLTVYTAHLVFDWFDLRNWPI